MGDSADLYTYRFEDQRAVPFVTTEKAEVQPVDRVQPDVYVTSFPDGEQTLTVSPDGGAGPAWSRHGGHLFYNRRRP